MAKILGRKAPRISLPGAATLLIVTMLFAQVLGFLRTKLVNANFPLTGPESTDVYFAAFKIPDFFFYVLAAGVLGVVLIPILTERMQKSDRKGVWNLSNSLMNLMALITLGIGVIILLFAEQLMHVVAPNLSPEQLSNATAILRLIAFNPLFFTLSGILTSTQQVFGRFFFFAITPLVYNLAIIVSIFLFKDSLGLVGLGVGALLGGLLQFLVALAGVTGLNFHWRPEIDFKNVDFKRILRQLPARSLDQGVDSVNSIVETNRARLLGDGVVSSYENAFVLHTAPILLIGSSISTAAFPRLSELVAQGRMSLFRKEFIGILRVLMWVALPVMILVYFCRGYLARIIFTKGSPDIALILGFLSIAIFFRVIFTLLTRYFYAHKDSTTPLIISLFAIALNIILVFTLARPQAYGAAGLAIAQSITSATEVLILGFVIYLRDPKLFNRSFWEATAKLVSVSGFTMVVAFLMVTLLPLQASDVGFFVLGTKLGVISLVTIITHVSVSALFGFKEAIDLAEKTKKLILRPIRLQ
jgi:putative peptidoglycan lipid II flippase